MSMTMTRSTAMTLMLSPRQTQSPEWCKEPNTESLLLFFCFILYFIWSIHHCHHHHRHHAGQEQTLGSGWLHFPSAIQVVLWESPSNFIPSSHLDLIWKHVEIWLVINGYIFRIYLKSRTKVDLNVMTLCSVDWLPSSQPLGRLKKIVKIWIVKWFCWTGEW